MKKAILILICFLSFSDVALASTKTYERTKDNLRVPSSVTVNSENIDYILNTKAVDASEKIYDYAALLSEKEEEEIFEKIKKFIDDSSMDLVIITEKDDSQITPVAYAYNFYDYNNFKKEGLIFFIQMIDNNYNIYMFTSGEVFNIYTEKRIQDILEYVHNFFENKEYFEGIDSFVKIVHSFYIADKKGELVEINKSGEVVKSIPWVDLVVLSLAITFIIMYFLLKKKKEERKDYISKKLNRKIVQLNKSQEYIEKLVLKLEKK